MSVDLLSNPFFSKSYEVRRYAAPTLTKGKLDAKTPSSTLTMVASVQSLNYLEVMKLPEGFRTKDAVKVYTKSQLQLVTDQTMGDRFTYKGKIYEIMFSADWLDFDLDHMKYVGIKVEQD